MAVNPNIALSFQAPKIESPVNMMAQMQQLQGGQQANELRAMQMADMRTDREQQNALSEFMRNYQPGVTDSRQALSFGRPGAQVFQQLTTAARDRATEERSRAQAAAENIKVLRDILPSVTRESFPQWQATASAMLPQFAQLFAGEYSPERVEQLIMTADQALARVAEDRKTQGFAPNTTLMQGGRVIGQTPPAPETPTATMREYERAVAQGFTGTFMDYQARLRAAGAPRSSNTVVMPPGPLALVKELGNLDAKRIGGMIDDAQSAMARLAQLDRIDVAAASKRFTTGIFGPQRQFLSQAAEFLGLDPSRLVDGQGRPLLGDAATADTIDAASKEIAAEFAKNMSRVTNMSLGFIRDALPNLSRTPEGNAVLNEVMRSVAQRQIELGRLADKFARIGDTRPPGQPSMFELMADLDRNSPVITPELRRRIEEGSRPGPRSPAGETPAGAATGRATTLSPIDRQALDWAQANPNTPQAAEIRRRLGR
jgi:hypothetical protein